MSWWNIRYAAGDYDHIHAVISQETHEEEQLLLLERHEDLVWNRLRIKWASKHRERKIQFRSYNIPHDPLEVEDGSFADTYED